MNYITAPALFVNLLLSLLSLCVCVAEGGEGGGGGVYLGFFFYLTARGSLKCIEKVTFSFSVEHPQGQLGKCVCVCVCARACACVHVL